MKPTPQQWDTIRRAVQLAEAEDWLGLPRRTSIANRLSQRAYTRTRDRLEARRVPAKH